jgi:hypothetical protein
MVSLSAWMVVEAALPRCPQAARAITRRIGAQLFAMLRGAFARFPINDEMVRLEPHRLASRRVAA